MVLEVITTVPTSTVPESTMMTPGSILNKLTRNEVVAGYTYFISIGQPKIIWNKAFIPMCETCAITIA